MSAPTPADSDPEDPGLQRPGFGRPSPTLLKRADRGYARFLAHTTQSPDGFADGRDDTAKHG
ncbi:MULTISPECIES: hypothetical protein [Streptomyces]|uniref:hypothetical protein n=1 Tax=Streptomyces TaxID=1883 RepID=UPI001361B3ED|nr:hypothetical protein [Streptomyces sp. SID724]